LLTGLEAGQGFTISADGAQLAYAKTQVNSNLWLVERPGPNRGAVQQPKPLTRGTAHFGSLSVSRDGQWLAFVKGQAVFKMPVEGGTPVQLTFSDAVYSATAWSPDGRRIAFGSNHGGTHKVWVVGADGGNPRQVATTRLSPYGDITWWPGSQILYQKPGNRNFGMLDPDSGVERSLLQDESVGWIFEPKYSPDAKSVLAVWNRKPTVGLWVISLIDNSTAALRAGWLFPVGWSPDGRSVYAFSVNGNTIVSIPAAGGDPQIVATLPGEIEKAVITADGKKIVCNVMERKSDVWLVENFDRARGK
jgi:Tol biopolymer transport system component